MRSIIGLSAYALTGVAAIMIPPNSDIAADGTISIAIPNGPEPIETFGVDPYSQIVELPCPGCPYAQFGEQGVSWTREQENKLVLNISLGTNTKTMELNGVQIYPPVLSFAGEPEVLQVPSDMTLAEIKAPARRFVPAHSLRLSAWSLEAKSAHTGAGEEEIIDMHLRVHALEQRPVQIPEVIITAVKDRNAELLIINARASKEIYDPAEECKTWPLLCRWKATVAQRLGSMRHKFMSGCHKASGMMGMGMHGKKPHHGRPHHRPHGASGKRPHHRPHHVKPHHRPQSGEQTHHRKPHHHHHEHHPFMNKVAQILLTIVIPLLVGILAGMVTYLVGMLFGMAIAFVWGKIRSRRARYAPVALTEEDEEEGRVSFEKGELTEEAYEDAPPIYVREEQD